MGKDYILSFTAASLMVNETRKIAQLYFNEGDWERVKSIVLEKNIIQKNTKRSIIRQFNELRKRLKSLTLETIEKIAYDELENAKYLIFFANLKIYHLIFEFVVEVIRDKYQALDYSLSYVDFDRFLRDKEAIDNNIAKLKDTSRAKLRQVTFLILKQAGMLEGTKQFKVFSLTPGAIVSDEIIKYDINYLYAFLLSEQEIVKYKAKS